ncbi:MAG TPA: hypothetical protein VIJ79_02165 [Acidobacteriaceae bacterium]
MATDYRQVLKELREEESRLKSELDVIRTMIPGAELMAKRMPTHVVSNHPAGLTLLTAPYSGMGPKQAIQTYLQSEKVPRMPSDIVKALIEGGIVTRANDFSGMVGSTLTQMKAEGLLDRVEDGWQLKVR